MEFNIGEGTAGRNGMEYSFGESRCTLLMENGRGKREDGRWEMEDEGFATKMTCSRGRILRGCSCRKG